MIVRIDDVSPNTDFDHLYELYHEIKDALNPSCVYFAVTLLSKWCLKRSVYPGVPFKDREDGFFYGVDSTFDLGLISQDPDIQVASHGLLHMDHSKCVKQVQELSILTSCSLLKSKVFVPPFNRYNHITEAVCKEHRIKLMKPQEGWRSLDYHAKVLGKFNPNHKHWYLHPWRWTLDEFKEKVSGKVRGFIPRNNGTHSKHLAKGKVL